MGASYGTSRCYQKAFVDYDTAMLRADVMAFSFVTKVV